MVSKQRALPPDPPDPEDCCGSGCSRCVWDVYYDALEAFQYSVRDAEEVGMQSFACWRQGHEGDKHAARRGNSGQRTAREVE